MSTPRRITERDQPVFPCWAFNPAADKGRGAWVRLLESFWLRATDTHWHPDQPTEPTERPPALERELAAKDRELAVVRAELAKWKDRVTDISTATEATVEGLRAELAAARERIAALEAKNKSTHEN